MKAPTPSAPLQTVGDAPCTLTCLPKSICSWDYRLEGAQAGSAEVRLSNLSEQGGVTLGDYEFDVCKHGMMSGTWTMEHEGRAVATARKPNAFRNRFELTAAEQAWILNRSSVFSRTFKLYRDQSVVASIVPVHAFTRRANVTYSASLPQPVLLFSFWLAAMVWRRMASNNNAG